MPAPNLMFFSSYEDAIEPPWNVQTVMPIIFMCPDGEM